MTATLEKAFAEAAKLPSAEQEAFAEFLLEELEFLAAVEKGVRSADEGRLTPVEDVKKMVGQWAFESSSRRKP